MKDVSFENIKKNKTWERKQNSITSNYWSITYIIWKLKKREEKTCLGGGSNLRNSIKKVSKTAWQAWLKPCKVICRAVHVIWIYVFFFKNIVWISCNSAIYCHKKVVNKAHKGCYDLGEEQAADVMWIPGNIAQQDVPKTIHKGKDCKK